jgi:hypothetical protein
MHPAFVTLEVTEIMTAFFVDGNWIGALSRKTVVFSSA